MIGERNLGLLLELRYVASEVGYREARRMPTEVRRWWIDQMQKEAQQRQGLGSEAEQRQEGYRKTVSR